MNITIGRGRIEPNGPIEPTWVRFGDGPKIPLADLTPEQRKRVKAAGLLREPPARRRP